MLLPKEKTPLLSDEEAAFFLIVPTLCVK